MAAEFPTLPNAFSISRSKSSLGCFTIGGVGSGGLFVSDSGSTWIAVTVLLPSDFEDPECKLLLLSRVRSSAGGRDFISFALAREIVGTVQEEMTGAKY